MLHTDPTGKYPRAEDDPNPRELTGWLYREMKQNLNDPRLQAVQRKNRNGLLAMGTGTGVMVAGVVGCNPLVVAIGGIAVGAGLAAVDQARKEFANLVADRKPWDFKHKIRERLGPGITLCTTGGCKGNVEYSVPGNIHFGFVAMEAGYNGFLAEIGGGVAEYQDPAHKDPNNPYNGKLAGWDSAGLHLYYGDDPLDNLAVKFGAYLYHKYARGRSLTLPAFKRELARELPRFAKEVPDRNVVDARIARKWPYPVGYFNPQAR